MMKLEWAQYRHFPYEKELAVREVAALLGEQHTSESEGYLIAESGDLEAARKLTYFAKAGIGKSSIQTFQTEMEASAALSQKRQSTRYSVHGIHEYRGKFNPQICGALINILGVAEDQKLIDPFCGSGTTLVECAHRNIEAFGSDLNPLAVFIANAKLSALGLKTSTLESCLADICKQSAGTRPALVDDERTAYLSSWFEETPHLEIEALRIAIENQPSEVRAFFFVVASNLLRDFSLQNPADLRIRRRSSANQTEPFSSAFKRSAAEAIARLASAQKVIKPTVSPSRALLCDNRFLHERDDLPKFDAAITSPPYATALPYIDTQRLSLVWLNLLKPEQIMPVEATLIGSREMKTKERREMVEAILVNDAQLPTAEAQFCIELQSALDPNDGFRRQAMPALLYRYFDLMAQTFAGVSKVMSQGAPFALIVGHNHTTLGGRRFDIDTPAHLASLASHAGWTVQEITPLQPYQRFGLHAANATKAETLLILRKR